MPATTKRLRVGLIGANPKGGWGSQAHAPAIQGIPSTELYAVCTAHEETARASAEKLGVELAYHDHKTLLANNDIDAVAVAVRVPMHHQITLDALRAGKHVYTEWPLVRTVKEAQELTDTAKRMGVRTMVGLQRRASPPHIRLKEVVAEGYVGEVLSVRFNMQTSGVLTVAPDRAWRRDKSMGTNTMTVTFGHEIDAIMNAVGEITEVSGVVSTQVKRWQVAGTKEYVDDVTIPDNIIMQGSLQNGAVITAHVGNQPFHASSYKLEIYGRDGTLVMIPAGDGGFFGGYQILGGRKDDSTLKELPVPDRLKWVPDTLKGGAYNVGQMWEIFAESIRSGKDVEPTFETALKRHHLLEAIQASSDLGKRMRLPA